MRGQAVLAQSHVAASPRSRVALMLESCPACDARKVVIAAIDAPPDELHRMDGRVTFGDVEVLVEFGPLALQQTLEPVPRIEVFWFGDVVMEMVAPDAMGREGRFTMTDGPWTGALANIRAELEARFGVVELGGVHLH